MGTTEDSSSEAPSGVQKPEAVATGDTDSVVARQNQLNERQVQDANSNQNEGANTGGNKSAASKDIHNDTTVSDISADITMDSVKDHTISHKPPEVVVTDVAAGEAGAAASSSNGDAGQVAAAAEVS